MLSIWCKDNFYSTSEMFFDVTKHGGLLFRDAHEKRRNFEKSFSISFCSATKILEKFFGWVSNPRQDFVVIVTWKFCGVFVTDRAFLG